jgi:hypothetical protein
MPPTLKLIVSNSTHPEVPDGTYPLTYREGGLCGEGQYTAFDRPGSGVPVWFDLNHDALHLPAHLEERVACYPLDQLPQGGRVDRKAGAFDWCVEEAR